MKRMEFTSWNRCKAFQHKIHATLFMSAYAYDCMFVAWIECMQKYNSPYDIEYGLMIQWYVFFSADQLATVNQLITVKIVVLTEFNGFSRAEIVFN